MSARLKLKHMKHRIAMLEAVNYDLRYEVSRLNRKLQLIGAREQLKAFALEMAPRQYCKSVISHIAERLSQR